MPLVGKNIATTTDNFGDMVRKDCLLVDKTLMIKEFVDHQDNAVLITRPRRFGKTLNLSMLQHFFSEEIDGVTTGGLFDAFEIAKVDNGNFIKQYQGQYPVIFITFKDIKEMSYEAAINKIKDAIADLYRQHRKILGSDKLDDEDKSKFKRFRSGAVNNTELQNGIKYLSALLYSAYNKKVIILIDEYDTPLNSAHTGEFLEELSIFFGNMLSAALKSNNYLEKGLMTGVLRVSKNNMLSELNNLKIYTILSEKYAQYFGFTESEVTELVSTLNVKEELKDIRKFYNGYKFGETVIYNPWSIMNFLDEKKLAPYWLLTSNDKLLKELLPKSNIETKKQLNDLIKGESIEGNIDINLRYDELMEKPSALWTLLLFCGYLKSEHSQLSEVVDNYICELKIPNNEVMRLYNGIFVHWLEEKIGYTTYHSFLKSLVEGRVEEFTESLTAYLFACTSGHDFQAESDYHCFVLGLLASIKESHYVLSNKEYGAGRPDCLLIPKDKNNCLGIVIEFKHLHLKDKDRKDIDLVIETSRSQAKMALEQINMRGYSYAFAEYPYITEVLKIGTVFSHRMVSMSHTRRMIKNGVELEGQEKNEIHSLEEINDTPSLQEEIDALEHQKKRSPPDNPEIVPEAKRLKKKSGKLAVLKSSEDSLALEDFSEKSPSVHEDKQPAKKQKIAHPHGGHGVFEQAHLGYDDKASPQQSSEGSDIYDKEDTFLTKK